MCVWRSSSSARCARLLDHVTLVGVQTPGVANVTADEDPDGDEDDD